MIVLLFFFHFFFPQKGPKRKKKKNNCVSPLRRLHVTSIAAQFSVEKSQVSYTVVYLGRFSAMAVKWCVFPSQLEELVRGIFTLEGVGRGGGEKVGARTPSECWGVGAPPFSHGPVPYMLQRSARVRGGAAASVNRRLVRCLSVDGRVERGLALRVWWGWGAGSASCSRTGREGRRCCWWGGRGGPGTTVTRPGSPARAAAGGGEGRGHKKREKDERRVENGTRKERERKRKK